MSAFTESQKAPTNKKNSEALRFWHWANAVVISGSLITVLVNSTILKPRKSAPLVLTELQKTNPTVTLDQARSVVNMLEDKVWDVHVYFGYTLAALLLLRIMAEFFSVTERRLINQIKKAWISFKTIKQQMESARHDVIVKSIYVIFYVLLLVIVVTGLVLAFDDELGLSKAISHSVKEVHGFCMYPVLAFIVIHLVGVWLAERKANGKGIVSDMINGG